MVSDCNLTRTPITLRFQSGAIVHPIQSTFSYSKDEFDVFQCKIDSKTAQDMNTYIEGQDDVVQTQDLFTDTQWVQVRIAGDPARRMYFEPEFLKLGNPGGTQEASGFLELHDLREQLKKGAIDFAPQQTTTEKTFKKIYDGRKNEKLISNLIFNENDGKSLTVRDNDEAVKLDYAHGNDDRDSYYIQWGYSLHWNNTTPLAALRSAEEKHGVGTHIGPRGDLIVGEYQGGNTWTASNLPSKSYYHVENSALGETNKKVKQVHLVGPQIEEFDREGGSTSAEGSSSMEARNADKFLDWIDQDDEGRRGGTEEYGWILHLYITNTEANGGTTLRKDVKDLNPHKQDLEKVGKRHFLGVQTKTRSGRLNINMDSSEGEGPSSVGPNSEYPQAPRIKDKIIYESGGSGCVDGITGIGGDYYVSDVTHTYNKGSWDMEVGVFKVPTNQSELEVRAEFYDLSTGQTYSHEDVYGYPLGEG